MIKLEHEVLASPEQMEFIIEGMRNPMNSWDRSDSKINMGCYILRDLDNPTHYHVLEDDEVEDALKYCNEQGIDCVDYVEGSAEYILGEADKSLMLSLANAGTDHRKFMRMMPVYVRITAPLYWWKEFDTYKVGTVANSCSTMHKIQAREFTFDDFSFEHLLGMEDNPFKVNVSSDGTALSPIGYVGDTISMLNGCREKCIETKDKKFWWQMIQLLPSSYNQTRNVMMNYEVLANIYKSRKNHKLDEWREFCKWIESLPYSELIIGG